ncbi:MAG TPA: dienelactone hydrolase family protein [Saprospiraceae bacterium]|nr:dienelactone hydrolase family protein [Saprospiraceae bacterium]
MKQFFFFAFLLALSACRQANPVSETGKAVMCSGHDDAVAQFASFADNAEFRGMHPDPLPVEVTKKGKMIDFPVAGGANGHAFLVKSRRKTDKYLLLFHEWWGLNDYIKNEAAMWSKELGVHVLAIDLYDGKVAANAEEAGKMMQANDPARSLAIIDGAAKFAGDKADFRTMGWCFGGGWSLQAALRLNGKVKACVVYYGMPEQDVAKLKTLSTDVVFIHPEQDKWLTAEVVGDFEKNMKSAGKAVMVYHYPADHAFANPSSPRYNEKSAREARAVVTSYLKGK